MHIMSTEDKKKEDIFADWVPEVVEYDPEIDGGSEHLERDEHLATKEKLKEQILKHKEKRRINKVRR
jgi:hypothetical protein